MSGHHADHTTHRLVSGEVPTVGLRVINNDLKWGTILKVSSNPGCGYYCNAWHTIKDDMGNHDISNCERLTTSYRGMVDPHPQEEEIKVTVYLATINTPGYLPSDDDPPTFETARDAWAYLADERGFAEDDTEGFEGYSSVHNMMEGIGDGTINPNDGGLDYDATGTIYGDTPGYDGDHDLGLAYSVTIVEDPS